MQNDTSTLENSLAISYKTKYILTIWSSNHIPWNLPKWVKNLCLQKNLHKNVYRSSIHNCQNLEATKMTFSKWMDKPWYIQKIKYFSIFIEKYYTKKWAISAYKWNLKCILLNERSQSEKATYYMIPTIWHSGKGKTIETLKKKSVVARGFGEGLASEAQVIFRAVKILCVILLI